MKKSLVLLPLLTLSFAAYANANANSNIESTRLVECKTGGCDLVCVTANGSQIKKATNVRTARITVFKSGTVEHYLNFNYETGIVTTPSGTASCILTNVVK